jgi:hypothetical protein
MVTSFVVRLVADGLEHGEFSGEVQHVETGHRVVIRSGDELLAALCAPLQSRSAAEERS